MRYRLLSLVFFGLLTACASTPEAQPDTPPIDQTDIEPTITSFEDCVAAGNAVMESYPRQCRTAGGKLFVENISSDDAQEVGVTVTNVQAGDIVRSPLTVEGSAKGTWYFEASFGLQLLNAQGNILDEAPAQAEGNWMTEEQVPFTGTLTFNVSKLTDATLVLRKANPSGLPENDAEIRLPVLLSQ